MEIRISVTVGAGIQLYAVRPQQTAQGEGGTASWNDITGKPSTFPPSSHTHLISEVTALQSALDGKAATSHTHTINEITGLEDQLSEKADLVGGFIPTSQIPAQAITEFLGDVANQAAMLALTGQRGDWCIRTDQNRTYFLIADDASQLSNWRYIETTASPVTSVNGQVGVIVLGKGDVGLGNVNNTSDADKPVSTAQAAALAGKASSTHGHAINEVTGLQEALDGKAAWSHSHAISSVTGLQAAIDSKSNTGHTHTASEISDFAAAVRAILLTGLESGSNAAIAATDTLLAALAKLQAQITAQVSRASQLDVHSDISGNFTFTSMPNSESTLAQGNARRGVLRYDLTNNTQLRLVATVVTASISANSPRLYPQYSLDLVEWVTIGTGAIAGDNAIDISSNGAGKATIWHTIPAPARGDVYLRVAANGGNGSASPAFGNVAIQVR